MFIGITLCKNMNKYKFPIVANIEQHVGLFKDGRIFVVPLPGQDVDHTIATIEEACKKFNQEYSLLHVDWPTEEGFHIESIDKILQQKAIDLIEKDCSPTQWVIKHDADEFISERDFEKLFETVKLVSDTDITLIGMRYRQFVGSCRNTVWDPTTETYHVYRVGSGAHFPGNDAMNVKTMGESIILDDVYVNHFGYVKSHELLNTKVREHVTLNKSVYSNRFTDEQLTSFKWEFPLNVKGKRLWPLGIGPLSGQPNEAEYFPFDISQLPYVLRRDLFMYDYYVPTQ